MTYSLLKYELDGAVAVITLNNPPANGMSPEFLFEIEDVIKQLDNDKSARAVLFVSACEGFFSAGADLTMLQGINEETLDMLPRAQAIFNAIEDIPLPTVAAISGHVLGGGLELALTCDFRFMARDSGRIGLPEVRLGLIPSFGGTQRLTGIVGRGKGLEMMIKGLQLKPDDAKEIGLLTDVFEADQLLEKSMDYAHRLAKQATFAIGMIKRCVITGAREGFERGIEEEAVAFRKNIDSKDAQEGVDAFLSGRKPKFVGS